MGEALLEVYSAVRTVGCGEELLDLLLVVVAKAEPDEDEEELKGDVEEHLLHEGVDAGLVEMLDQRLE